MSPELVLVDPVLATEARALLPERPWIEPVRLDEVPPAALAPGALSAWAPDDDEVPDATLRPAATPRRRLSIRAAGFALATAAFFVLAFDLVPSRGPEPALVPAGQDRLVQRALSPTDASAATESLRADDSPTGATSGAARGDSGATARSTGEPASGREALETPRTFVWPEIAGAAGYEFQLLRGAELVYRSRTSEPRLVIPVRWKHRGRSESLRHGTYRWYVWPIARGDARPAARAIVQAELVVTG